MNDEIKKEYAEFQKQYRKDYYQENKTKLLAQQKEYRKRNWEKVRAAQYEWQKNNPEKWAEQRARNKANLKLRALEFKKTHPETYRLNAQGKYIKLRASKYTPEQKIEKRKAWARAQWQKEKNDPVKILKHRNRSLVYAHKMYHIKKKQKLRLRLIEAINQHRLTKLKEELYADIEANKRATGRSEPSVLSKIYRKILRISP